MGRSCSARAPTASASASVAHARASWRRSGRHSHTERDRIRAATLRRARGLPVTRREQGASRALRPTGAHRGAHPRKSSSCRPMVTARPMVAEMRYDFEAQAAGERSAIAELKGQASAPTGCPRSTCSRSGCSSSAPSRSLKSSSARPDASGLGPARRRAHQNVTADVPFHAVRRSQKCAVLIRGCRPASPLVIMTCRLRPPVAQASATWVGARSVGTSGT